jgi:WXG100 family type VII secretion target
MTVRYSFAALADLSTAIAKAHSCVDTVKSDIQAASSTLQAGWDGSAGESWAVAQLKWTSACDDLNAALNQLSKRVLAAGEEMAQTESLNASRFDPDGRRV